MFVRSLRLEYHFVSARETFVSVVRARGGIEILQGVSKGERKLFFSGTYN